MKRYGKEYAPYIRSRAGGVEDVTTFICDNLCASCAVRLYDLLTAVIKRLTIQKPKGKSNITEICLNTIKSKIIDDENALNCPFIAVALVIVYVLCKRNKDWKSLSACVEKIHHAYQCIDLNTMITCRNPETALCLDIMLQSRREFPIQSSKSAPLKKKGVPLLLKNLDSTDESEMVWILLILFIKVWE